MTAPIPDVAVPRAVAKAAATVRDREADVAAAKAAIQEANRAIEQALSEDRALLAEALDAGRTDPGTPREGAARQGLADAERRQAGEELRLQRARAALDEAVDEHVDGWQTQLTKALEQADAEVLDLVARLEAAEQERTRRRQMFWWARAKARGEQLPVLGAPPPARSPLLRNQQAGDDVYVVPELLTAVRAGVEQSTASADTARIVAYERRLAEQQAEAARIAERERREAEHAARVAEVERAEAERQAAALVEIAEQARPSNAA